jgi:hypothetical protein
MTTAQLHRLHSLVADPDTVRKHATACPRKRLVWFPFLAHVTRECATFSVKCRALSFRVVPLGIVEACASRARGSVVFRAMETAL